MNNIIELPIFNNNNKLKIDIKDYELIKNYKIYFSNSKYKHLYIIKNNRCIRLVKILYNPGKERVVKYLDGNIFNLTSENIKLIYKKYLNCTGHTTQIRDDKNFTVKIKDKILKFDEEDYLKIKDLTFSLKNKSYIVFNRKLKINTTLQKFLFKKELMTVIFKNNDNTDFRRKNIELVIKKLAIKNESNKFSGIKKLCNGYQIKCNSNEQNFLISLNCSKLDAAVVYNYKTREINNSKILQVNNTKLTIEEENKIAESLLKNTYYNTIYKKHKICTSLYFGVNYDERLKKWMCRPTFKKKRYYLGVFEKEIDAALAYNKKAIEILGDKARLNFIKE